MLYFEQYGSPDDPAIVFLHGANYTFCFEKQYELAEHFHLLVPHLPGYGREASRLFTTETAVKELVEFIEHLHKKVILVGFSLGAQLAVKLLEEHSELFLGGVIVSAWLIKSEPMFTKVMKANEKQHRLFRKKGVCRFIGLMNGFSKEARADFAETMQMVSLQTTRNAVDNKITPEHLPGFASVNVPMIAMVGGKEVKEAKDSARWLAETNPNCTCEVWEKAGHNIPILFAKEFNGKLQNCVEAWCKIYRCPCCGKKSFISPMEEAYYICPACRWENDPYIGADGRSDANGGQTMDEVRALQTDTER